MTILNPTLNPINPQERVKINQNWQMISARFSNLQGQIQLVSGGQDVEAIIARIETTISNAETATSNTVLALQEVSNALSDLQTIMNNANVLNDNVQTAIDTLNESLNAMIYTGPYDNGFTYQKGNYVRLQKDSYVALKENTGITPTDDGINWRLVAVGGIDGQGAVNSVNGISPDSSGNVVLDLLKLNDLNVINVKDFGALGDGVNDDSNSINSAIASSTFGDTLFFPKGIYLLRNQLVLPKGVKILGIGSDLAPQFYNGQWETSSYGSVIAIDFGVGNTEERNSALLLTSYNEVKGVNFWYINQSGSTNTPNQYPPTIGMANGDSEESNNAITQVTIEDCVFVNSYICMSFTSTHELLNIRNVRFAAWYRGIIVEKSLDVDRLSNIHSNPNISYRGEWPANGILNFHILNDQTKGFLIGSSDHIYINKCFVFGFNTCLEFNVVTSGNINGCFVNQSGFEGSSKCVSLLGDYRRVSINQCMFGTFPGFNGAEATIYASKDANNSINELRMIDCHVFSSNGRPLQLENQNDVFVSNSHFYDSLAKPSEFQTEALRIFGCKKVQVSDCTISLNTSNLNAIYYNVENSNMVSLNNVYFSGHKGDVGSSSSTILNSSHVRIVSPRYTDSNNTNTFQNASTDSTITDLISY